MKPPPFYPILDTLLLARAGLTLEVAAESLLSAGARILQLRHKGHFTRDVFGSAQKIARMCRETSALFVIDDRADIAALLGAALHLGQDDLVPADARRVVPASTIIGFSTHNEAQMLAAHSEPVDYLALGPVFQTGSKQNPDPVVGLDEFRRLRAVTNRSLVAIGGITRANARTVLDAGADSVAVIGDLLPDVRACAEEWMLLTR